ncbi:MAG TPA: ATP synthase F1 subunit delta [Acidimicrobiales bacterium]|nr:ATP synthase F1 subunit delta [Acidimicrobiales bacterium]
MRESIRGFADAIVGRAAAEGRRPRVAADLVAFTAAVARSEDLRRILSDPGLPAHIRRSVVTDLLADKAEADATALATFAVDADRATELLENLRWLAWRAGRDQVDDDGPLGRVAAAERLDGYASGILGPVAAEGRLGEVEDELFRFSRIVAASEDLLAVLTDRNLAADRRTSLVSDLLQGRAQPDTVSLAVYATRVSRPRDIVSALDALVSRVADEADRRVAEVHSAVALDDSQRQRLGGALARIVGRRVDVRVTVDPAVVGGFVASVGDVVVDGSVRHRLNQLRERLALPAVTLTAPGSGAPNTRDSA